MKKLLFLFLFTISIIFFNSQASASITLEDGRSELPYYTETIISDIYLSPESTFFLLPQSVDKTTTKTKTTQVKVKDGTVLWSVSITATFTYNGTTSNCISCSHNATSYAKTWSIKSVSSKKNRNTATATAVATHSNGSISQDFSQSVTIECSKDGIVS